MKLEVDNVDDTIRVARFEEHDCLIALEDHGKFFSCYWRTTVSPSQFFEIMSDGPWKEGLLLDDRGEFNPFERGTDLFIDDEHTTLIRVESETSATCWQYVPDLSVSPKHSDASIRPGLFPYMGFSSQLKHSSSLFETAMSLRNTAVNLDSYANGVPYIALTAAIWGWNE